MKEKRKKGKRKGRETKRIDPGRFYFSYKIIVYLHYEVKRELKSRSLTALLKNHINPTQRPPSQLVKLLKLLKDHLLTF